MPNTVHLVVDERHRHELSRLLPWTSGLRKRDGRATAYVCRDFACQTPTSSAEELRAQLEELAKPKSQTPNPKSHNEPKA